MYSLFARIDCNAMTV